MIPSCLSSCHQNSQKFHSSVKKIVLHFLANFHYLYLLIEDKTSIFSVYIPFSLRSRYNNVKSSRLASLKKIHNLNYISDTFPPYLVHLVNGFSFSLHNSVNWKFIIFCLVKITIITTTKTTYLKNSIAAAKENEEAPTRLRLFPSFPLQFSSAQLTSVSEATIQFCINLDFMPLGYRRWVGRFLSNWNNENKRRQTENVMKRATAKRQNGSSQTSQSVSQSVC